ncbi:MAG: penicillin-binding protein 1C [Pseudomonadota bacterium]
MLFGLALSFLLLPALPALAALPSFQSVKAAHIPSEAWLLDRHGEVIHSLRVNDKVRRLPWVSLSVLSPAMTQALLVSEDKRFMEHTGVDWRAVVSAMWDNLSGASHRGASTLTMQLAGLLDPDLNRPTGGRSLGQKWDQMKEARALERTWTKQQILEAYLNRVNFRGELAGIHAAARGLFRKHPSGLSKAEASLLAALLRGPNAEPAVVARRACGVAALLAPPRPTCNQIQRLARVALARPAQIETGPQLAPHFARQFVARLAKPPKGGDRLTTPLDARLQRLATQALEHHLARLLDRQVSDGAAVVLDNKSGEILAYVGASGLTSLAPEVDGVTAPRLPGSALKPFLYGLAIEQGLLTAASPLDDSPLALDTPTGQYVPQNYERDFKGWVSLRSALGSSLNVPAVRTLVLVGGERFLQRLRDLGLATLKEDADFYGYSLALGGGEVTLLDLANAYRTLANGGLLKPVAWQPGNMPPSADGGGPGRGLRPSGRVNTPGVKVPARRVMSAPASHIIGDILADKSARTLAFGLNSPLETTGWAAVKTGTSKDMRDNWALGYTPRYTVGVWVGNASGAPMHDVSGITGAAPVWQTIMNALQAPRPATQPPLPPGVERRPIRFEPPLEPDRQELFLTGTGQDLIALATDTAPGPRIQGPGNGAILALDPDIPHDRQQVRFSAHPPAPGQTWQMDGQPPDPAWLQPDGSLAWPPGKGPHRITLHGPDGKVLDAMFITVK